MSLFTYRHVLALLLLCGTLAWIGCGDGEEAFDLSAIASAHRMGLDALEEEFNDYKEETGVPVETGLGEGRMSEFTASTSFGGGIRGIRATLPGHDHGVRVTCQVSADEFDTIKPVFLHLIENVKPGD